MNIRLYFNRSFRPFNSPARLTVSDFENTALHPGQMPISYEISSKRSWGRDAGWAPIPINEQPEHLYFALQTLAAQVHRAKDALHIEHDKYVRATVSDNCIVELSDCSIGQTRLWNMSLRFHHNDGSREAIDWDKLRLMVPCPHEHLLREAVVRLLRKEVEMKVAHGFCETAPFSDLEIALKATGARYREASIALTALEPFSVA